MSDSTTEVTGNISKNKNIDDTLASYGSKITEAYTAADEKIRALVIESVNGLIKSEDIKITEAYTDADEKHKEASPIDHPDGSVTSEKIADGAVTRDKIESKAVDSDKIADLSVNGLKLSVNSVSTVKIVDKAVTTAKLDDEAVTEAKIADKAVTEAKIADKAVTEAKIADKAVTESKIADKAVTESKIADSAVTSEKLDESERLETLNIRNGSGNGALCQYNAEDKYNCSAQGKGSFAAGLGVIAKGVGAIGLGAWSYPDADYSFVANLSNITDGARSAAFGYYTYTGSKGANSAAFGAHTQALGENQLAAGIWNSPDESGDVLLMIGNGTSSDDKSNAFAVLKNGYAYVQEGITTKERGKLVDQTDMQEFQTQLQTAITDISTQLETTASTVNTELEGKTDYSAATTADGITMNYGGICYYCDVNVTQETPFYSAYIFTLDGVSGGKNAPDYQIAIGVDLDGNAGFWIRTYDVINGYGGWTAFTDSNTQTQLTSLAAQMQSALTSLGTQTQTAVEAINTKLTDLETRIAALENN